MDRPASADADAVVFEVTKVHHERKWLRQKRWLVITETKVMKCDVPSGVPLADAARNLSVLTVTKVHALGTLNNASLLKRNKLSMQFAGDHTYYYKSEHAPQIVDLLQQRHAMLKSATLLSPERPAAALSEFRTGRLPLGSETDAVRVRANTVEVMQLIRVHGLDGWDAIAELKQRLASLNATLSFSIEGARAQEMLAQVRQSLSEIRSKFVDQLMTGERSWSAKFNRRATPKFICADDAALCCEEALQSVVFEREEFHVVWTNATAAARADQQSFDDHARWMRERPNDFFGLHPDFHGVNFTLVTDHIGGLSRALSPSGMLERIVQAVKSIHTCVLSKQLQDNREEAKEYAVDEVLPALIFVLVSGRFSNICAVRTFVNSLGDLSEATERMFYFTLFASAVSYIVDTVAAPECGEDKEESPGTSHLLHELSPPSTTRMDEG